MYVHLYRWAKTGSFHTFIRLSLILPQTWRGNHCSVTLYGTLLIIFYNMFDKAWNSNVLMYCIVLFQSWSWPPHEYNIELQESNMFRCSMLWYPSWIVLQLARDSDNGRIRQFETGFDTQKSDADVREQSRQAGRLTLWTVLKSRGIAGAEEPIQGWLGNKEPVTLVNELALLAWVHSLAARLSLDQTRPSH